MALIGAGIGAGVGQLSGGNTKSTLMGAGIGAGAGYFGGPLLFGRGAGIGAAGGTTIAGTNAATLAAGTAPGAGAGAGGSGIMNAAMLGQGAMGLMNLYGGGSVSGYAPTSAIKMTPAGEKLEKSVFEKIQKQYETGLMPPNLASQYIGRIKVEEGRRARIARGILSSATTRRVGTGRQMLGAVSEAQSRMTGLAAPARRRTELKEEEFRNALANLQNIMNIEKQVPILRARSQFATKGLEQMRSAAKGEAIGQILNLVGYMNRAPA